jgi:mRNA interferase MazF
VEKAIKHGDVWLAFADEMWPVVLLSGKNECGIQAMRIVPPATQNIEGVAVEVHVGACEGLPHEAVLRVAHARPGKFNCNWLLTLSQTDLIKPLGSLSTAKLRELQDALQLGGLP